MKVLPLFRHDFILPPVSFVFAAVFDVVFIVFQF